MKPVEQHISNINSKLQELLKKHAILLKESEQQKKSIQKLEQENELKASKINLLEQQQHILKASAGKMEDVDKKEFEQVISKYIREIDKCINLLND